MSPCRYMYYYHVCHLVRNSYKQHKIVLHKSVYCIIYNIYSQVFWWRFKLKNWHGFYSYIQNEEGPIGRSLYYHYYVSVQLLPWGYKNKFRKILKILLFISLTLTSIFISKYELELHQENYLLCCSEWYKRSGQDKSHFYPIFRLLLILMYQTQLNCSTLPILDFINSLHIEYMN